MISLLVLKSSVQNYEVLKMSLDVDQQLIILYKSKKHSK